MIAVRFENNTWSQVNVPVPEPGGDEALVKVLIAGICGTDLEILRGYAAFTGIPGHEFVGTVESCASRPELAGMRVVADINCGCGECPSCLNGGARHCPDREVIGIRGRDGAFAEYCIVPARNLYPVPDNAETLDAVFTEPLAAALHISEQIHIVNRTRIAVLGDGKLGLLIALCLKHFSSGVILIGRHREKLAIAGDQGMTTFLIEPDAGFETVRRSLGRFDMTVDATGNPDGLRLAITLTRPQGTVVLKTTTYEKSGIDLTTIAVNELRLLGSRCGDLPYALRFLENRWIDVHPLVEAVYPLSRFDDALSRAMDKTSLKVLLAMADD